MHCLLRLNFAFLCALEKIGETKLRRVWPQTYSSCLRETDVALKFSISFIGIKNVIYKKLSPLRLGITTNLFTP